MTPELSLLRGLVAEQPYPLIFATISGAHLYGFASSDSDYDLRGVHILPARDVLGLMPLRETIEISEVRDGREIDLVTHDARKFLTLMLKRNGYVLEQLYSPLIVHTSPAHDELRELAKGCITRHHAHHYLGFAQTQWTLFQKEAPPRAKPLLYVYRVLLTGIHLMQTGEIEANLPRLNQQFRLPYIDDLIAQKTSTAEQTTLSDSHLSFHAGEYARLVRDLEDASRASHLPDASSVRPALSDFLVRWRTASTG